MGRQSAVIEAIRQAAATVEEQSIPQGMKFRDGDDSIEARRRTFVFYRELETDAGVQHIVWNASEIYGLGARKEEALYHFFANSYTRKEMAALMEALQKP